MFSPHVWRHAGGVPSTPCACAAPSFTRTCLLHAQVQTPTPTLVLGTNKERLEKKLADDMRWRLVPVDLAKKLEEDMRSRLVPVVPAAQLAPPQQSASGSPGAVASEEEEPPRDAMALSTLSGDEQGIILGKLPNTLEPRLVMYFSSASKELRALLTPAVQQQLRTDYEEATALCDGHAGLQGAARGEKGPMGL